MSIFKNLMTCICNNEKNEIEELTKNNKNEIERIKRDITALHTKASFMVSEFRRIDDKLDNKINILSNKIDNVILILNSRQ